MSDTFGLPLLSSLGGEPKKKSLTGSTGGFKYVKLTVLLDVYCGHGVGLIVGKNTVGLYAAVGEVLECGY